MDRLRRSTRERAPSERLLNQIYLSDLLASTKSPTSTVLRCGRGRDKSESMSDKSSHQKRRRNSDTQSDDTEPEQPAVVPTSTNASPRQPRISQPLQQTMHQRQQKQQQQLCRLLLLQQSPAGGGQHLPDKSQEHGQGFALGEDGCAFQAPGRDSACASAIVVPWNKSDTMLLVRDGSSIDSCARCEPSPSIPFVSTAATQTSTCDYCVNDKRGSNHDHDMPQGHENTGEPATFTADSPSPRRPVATTTTTAATTATTAAAATATAATATAAKATAATATTATATAAKATATATIATATIATAATATATAATAAAAAKATATAAKAAAATATTATATAATATAASVVETIPPLLATRAAAAVPATRVTSSQVTVPVIHARPSSSAAAGARSQHQLPTPICPQCEEPVLTPLYQSECCGFCGQYAHETCVDLVCTGKRTRNNFFCRKCPLVACPELLTSFRLGIGWKATQGSRDLVRACHQGRVFRIEPGKALKDPFGCTGFEFRPGLFSKNEQSRMLALVGQSPHQYLRPSSLTGSITDQSRKVYCCNDSQRSLRGSRYVTSPLRPSCTSPLIEMQMDDGQDMNTFITNLFPSTDPFVTKTELLCQQLAWHYEDLEPHCDRERKDKTTKRQLPGEDGVGDRITSLTLQQACWLLMRETKQYENCFAVRLQPGDVYTLSDDARWRWQHAICLDDLTTNPFSNNTDFKGRISIVWRLLEEYPL